MPRASFLGGVVSSYASSSLTTVIDNALGRPFELWTAQVQADNAPTMRSNAWNPNIGKPNSIPPPDAVYAAFRRGLLSPDVAAVTLAAQGVMPSPEMIAAIPNGRIRDAIGSRGMTAEQRQYHGDVWKNVAYMGMSRPDPGSIASAWVRGRIDMTEYARLRHGMDASWSRYRSIIEADYQSPQYTDVRAHWAMGRITDADYALWSRRAGWTDTPARRLSESISTLPTPTEVWLAHWRGSIPAARLRAYGTALGYVNDEDWRAVERAAKQLPGPSDLVRFAVREVWDEETARRLGYDEEFPEPFARWLGWYGQNWSMGADGTERAGPGSVTIPKAYWRAHWQAMSPEQSYRAFQLLRPDRIARYREISPDVTPFTAADLSANLKIADYPKPIRAWLQAIAFTPLDLRTVRALYAAGLRDRAWTIAQMQDRGLVREDAAAFVDLEDFKKRKKDRAAVDAVERSLVRATYRTVIESYSEGLITRDIAVQGLRGLGLGQAAIDRALALADSAFRFDTTKTALRQIRKAYLDGTLASTELPQYLTALGIDRSAHDAYIRRWNLQRTLQRRGLSTAQVSGLVAQGALDPRLGAVRLANLGWTAPDSALLIAVAQARLAKAQAAALAGVERQAKARQRELLAAQRQAQQASRQIATELRRITPLSALRRWFQLGIRKGPWILARLGAMGYDATSSDAYLRQWTMEYQTAGHPEAPAVQGNEKLARRQTSLATIKRWWQGGVVTDSWARARLAVMGYSAESIALYIRDWAGSLGTKPGPAPEGTVNVRPTNPQAQEGARPLDQQPRPLDQLPRPAEPGPR